MNKEQNGHSQLAKRSRSVCSIYCICDSNAAAESAGSPRRDFLFSLSYVTTTRSTESTHSIA